MYCIAHLLHSNTWIPRKPLNSTHYGHTTTSQQLIDKRIDRKCILRYVLKISVHVSQKLPATRGERNRIETISVSRRGGGDVVQLQCSAHARTYPSFPLNTHSHCANSCCSYRLLHSMPGLVLLTRVKMTFPHRLLINSTWVLKNTQTLEVRKKYQAGKALP